MGRKYLNPPVMEALCEFRFTPETPWDMAIPGLIYEKIQNEFPLREQRLIQEIKVGPGPEGLLQQLVTAERILYFSEDRKTCVQLGQRFISVNVLRPYPGWEKFRPKIETVFEAFMEVIEVKGFQRIGLRYINHIEVPEPFKGIENYFRYYVYIGPDLPQNPVNFIAGIEVVFAAGRDHCRVQLVPTPIKEKDCRAFVLDIDYFLVKTVNFTHKETIEWIENAHTEVEKIFEGCIKDKLRNLFGEEE